MKLGVLTNVVGNMPLEDALKYFKSMGIQMVEIGCGGFPGKAHCDAEALLHILPIAQEKGLPTSIAYLLEEMRKYDLRLTDALEI